MVILSNLNVALNAFKAPYNGRLSHIFSLSFSMVKFVVKTTIHKTLQSHELSFVCKW